MQESQEVSSFPTGDHKAARNRHDNMAKTNTNNKTQIKHFTFFCFNFDILVSYGMNVQINMFKIIIIIILYIIETPFNAFANRAYPDQAALVWAVWSGSTLFAWRNMIYLILHWWTWQVISFFYAPTLKFIYIIIHSGWSLAWIFMKERVKCNSFGTCTALRVAIGKVRHISRLKSSHFSD